MLKTGGKKVRKLRPSIQLLFSSQDLLPSCSGAICDLQFATNKHQVSGSSTVCPPEMAVGMLRQGPDFLEAYLNKQLYLDVALLILRLGSPFSTQTHSIFLQVWMGGFLSLDRGKIKGKYVLIYFGQGKSSNAVLQGQVQGGPRREMDLRELQNI